MTGPAARGTERGTRAPSRVTGTQGAVGAVLVVLALGLALRLIIAYLLPGSGFGVDLGAFRAWAANLASEGLNGFYQRDFFHDYTPGLPVRAVGARAGRAGHRRGRCRPHQGAGDPRRPGHRLAGLVDGPRARRPTKGRADRGVRRGRQPDQLVRQRRLGPGRLGRCRLPAAGAARAVARPPGAIGHLRGRGRADQAAARDPDPDPGAGDDPAGALAGRESRRWSRRGRTSRAGPPDDGWLARVRAWERRTDHPVRILTTGLVALATTVLLCYPFGLSVLEFKSTAPYFSSGLLSQIFATASGYPYLTVNAFNPWALVAGDTGNTLANSGLWVCDGPWTVIEGCQSGVASIAGIPPVLIGGALMLAVTLVVSLIAARRPDRLTILVGLAVLAIAFYVVPTRVHERYAYPAFALAIILAAIAWRWRLAYVALTVTVFLNMYAALTNPFYNNPGISDWLGIGPTIRGEWGVTFLAVANGAIFLWALAQVRPSALARLTGELAAERELADAEEWEFDGRGRAAPGRASRAGLGVALAAPSGAAGSAGAAARVVAPSAAAAVAFAPPAAAATPSPPALSPALAPSGRCRRSDGVLDAAAHPRRGRRRRLAQGALQRASGPPRPQRHAPPRGWRTARPARPVPGRAADPRDDAAPHVPAGRAVPDALRRGLPRADRHRVPPGMALRHLARHLRMDPPARRQVPDGRAVSWHSGTTR